MRRGYPPDQREGGAKRPTPFDIADYAAGPSFCRTLGRGRRGGVGGKIGQTGLLLGGLWRV